jgi:hypothetical protein
MTKRSWSTQDLDKLIKLSKECPPVVIAKELSRPVTSVRKKMREIGAIYVSGEEWKKRQIQFLLTEGSGAAYRSKRKEKSIEMESPVLDEFWMTLLAMARVAREREKPVDVLSFIDTYRKIRLGS